MASATGRGDAGGSSREILSARELPTRRILGKGLASIGYETELEGKRLARIEFRGVPSGIFEKEAVVLVNLKDHENVVKTHNWTVDKMSCSLVLEYMDGNLLDLLQRRKDQSNRSLAQPAFTLQEALGIMWQIARGMENLHEQDVLHGDLKTNNILVSARLNNGESGIESDSLVSVKVADFGLGRTKRKSIPFVSRQARKLDMVRWKAPECLQKLLSHLAEDNDETSDEDSDSDEDQPAWGSSGDTDSLQFRADVYSFALTCFQILTGEDPYPGLNWKEDVPGIVMGNLRPTLPASCPQLLKELLVSCWHKDPDQRPKSFSDIRTTLELLNAPKLMVYAENNEGAQGRRMSLYQGAGASSSMPITSAQASAKQSVVLERLRVASRPNRPDSNPLISEAARGVDPAVGQVLNQVNEGELVAAANTPTTFEGGPTPTVARPPALVVAQPPAANIMVGPVQQIEVDEREPPMAVNALAAIERRPAATNIVVRPPAVNNVVQPQVAAFAAAPHFDIEAGLLSPLHIKSDKTYGLIEEP